MKRVLSFFHKRFFYFLFGLILGIIIMIGLIRSSNLQDSVIINSYVPSPSGEYIAITYTNMGGGAAGYCYSYISVVPKWHPKGFDSYGVLGDRCGSSLNTSWKDNNTIIVTGKQDPFYSETKSKDGKIKVIFN